MDVFEFGNSFTRDFQLSSLFPYSPTVNALLATTYVVLPPTLALLLLPERIPARLQSILVCFAVGGGLADVFLEHDHGHGHGHGHSHSNHEETDGSKTLYGFLLFMMLDGLMRSTGHGHSHDHGHGHSHSSHDDHNEVADVVEGEKTKEEKEKTKEEKEKTKEKKEKTKEEKTKETHEAEVKSTAFLNILTDMIHNTSHTLPLTPAFMVSTHSGVVATFSLLMHHLPHVLGDYALLLQSGLTKTQAIKSILTSSSGAYIGVLLGAGISEEWIKGCSMYLVMVAVGEIVEMSSTPFDSIFHVIVVLSGVYINKALS